MRTLMDSQKLVLAPLALGLTLIATHSSAQPQLPDLVVRVLSFESVARPSTAPHGSAPDYYCVLKYEITNIGQGPAQSGKGYIASAFELAGVRVPGQGIPLRGTLSPRASAQHEVALFRDVQTPCLDGTTVKITVDPWEDIRESDELNNTATAVAIRAGAPRPPLATGAVPLPAAADLCTTLQPRQRPATRRKKTSWPTIGSHGEIVSAYTDVPSNPGSPSSRNQPLAAPIPSLWDTGQTLRVRIDGFSATDTASIQTIAQTWTTYVNLNLVFVGPGAAAEIRVAPGTRNNSRVGRDNLDVPASEPTMRLHTVNQRHVLHEFGHALGWIHEQQSPATGIHWDRPKVYAYFLSTEGWDKATVDENIFKLYSASSTNYSAYDPDSIMHYDVDASLTTDGVAVTAKSVLSPADKKYARLWYPFMGDTNGQLRTGDDCDTIDFRVEYSSKDAGRGYRFSLDQGAGMTWWKGLRIPLKNGQWYEFGVQDGTSATTSFKPDELDFSRPIGFGKAKRLGVQTWLSYTWPVMAALPKNTKIQFTWTRDRC